MSEAVFGESEGEIDMETGHPLDAGDLRDGPPTLSAQPPKRKPGRPPGSGKRTVIMTRQILTGEEGEEKTDEFSPLFEDVGHGAEKTITKVRVIRKEPDEGVLGYLEDPSVGEDMISARWGGGSYRLEGVNAKGKYIAHRVLKLAGNPIFQSDAAEVMWRRSRGLPTTTAPVASTGGGMSDVLTMMQSAEEKRRGEERDHAKAMRQMELDAEDRRRRDDDERLRQRKLDDEERDKRRRQDEEDRDRRRAADQATALQNQQQFMQQTIAMIQASSQQAIQLASAAAKPGGGIEESLRLIATVKEVFGNEGGGGDAEDTTMQTLFKALPGILQGAGSTIGTAIREVKGGGQPQPAQLPAAAPGGLLASIPANSPLAAKLDVLVTKIAMKGKDPEELLSKVADGLIAAMDGQTPAAPVATEPKPAAAETKPEVVVHQPAAPAFVSKAIHIKFPKPEPKPADAAA